MFEYLKQANLEKHGFVKTTEVSTETDENGKKTTKTSIHYKVTDDCSKVMYWESILSKRLPKKFTNPKIILDTVKEVESRITKSCTVILEVHPKSYKAHTAKNDVSKREARCRWPCWICRICFSARIAYGY